MYLPLVNGLHHATIMIIFYLVFSYLINTDKLDHNHNVTYERAPFEQK